MSRSIWIRLWIGITLCGCARDTEDEWPQGQWPQGEELGASSSALRQASVAGELHILEDSVSATLANQHVHLPAVALELAPHLRLIRLTEQQATLLLAATLKELCRAIGQCNLWLRQAVSYNEGKITLTPAAAQQLSRWVQDLKAKSKPRAVSVSGASAVAVTSANPLVQKPIDTLVQKPPVNTLLQKQYEQRAQRLAALMDNTEIDLESVSTARLTKAQFEAVLAGLLGSDPVAGTTRELSQINFPLTAPAVSGLATSADTFIASYSELVLGPQGCPVHGAESIPSSCSASPLACPYGGGSYVGGIAGGVAAGGAIVGGVSAGGASLGGIAAGGASVGGVAAGGGGAALGGIDASWGAEVPSCGPNDTPLDATCENFYGSNDKKYCTSEVYTSYEWGSGTRDRHNMTNHLVASAARRCEPCTYADYQGTLAVSRNQNAGRVTVCNVSPGCVPTARNPEGDNCNCLNPNP